MAQPTNRPRRHRWVIALMLTIVVVSLGLWLARRDPLPPEIRIASGAPGGLYHQVAEELAVRLQERLDRPVRVLDTAGTVENRRLLLDSKAELAIFQSGAAPMTELAALAPLYPDAVVVLVRKGSGISGVSQLRGRSIAIGPEGSGTRMLAQQVLRQYGVAPEDLKDSGLYFSALLENRKLEGAVVVAGLLNRDLERVLRTRQFEILPIEDGEAMAIRDRALFPYDIPRGVFAEGPPVPEKAVPTVATTAALVSRADAHSELVTAALAALYENDMMMAFPTLFGEEEAGERPLVPTHPTARQYRNPYEGIDTIASFMESLSAGKELLFALGAGIYLLWDQARRKRRREEERLLGLQREELDAYLNKTIQIEKAQIGVWDPDILRGYLEEVTRIKLDALDSLTHENLRDNRLFLIFITQCGHLIQKMQFKMTSGYRFDKTDTEGSKTGVE